MHFDEDGTVEEDLYDSYGNSSAETGSDGYIQNYEYDVEVVEPQEPAPPAPQPLDDLYAEPTYEAAPQPEAPAEDPEEDPYDEPIPSIEDEDNSHILQKLLDKLLMMFGG